MSSHWCVPRCSSLTFEGPELDFRLMMKDIHPTHPKQHISNPSPYAIYFLFWEANFVCVALHCSVVQTTKTMVCARL